jgi:peptide/nickel transport system substrate-binding protein
MRKSTLAKLTMGVLSVSIVMLLAVPFVGATTSKPAIKKGGSLTAILDTYTWSSLDPVTNTVVSADNDLFEPIYGALFYQRPAVPGGSSGPTLVDGEATGYKFSDHGLKVTITLRKGIKFSDGTPFNSQAVADNILRVISPAVNCTCDVEFGVIKSVSTPNAYTDVLNLSSPEPYIISNFPTEPVDYTPSPTALASEGETKFEQDPVGAGPFVVVSNSDSNELVMAKNPHYYVKGEPYLNQLTFIATPVDQSAYAALESGEAEMEVGISTASLIKQAETDPGQFKVWQVGGTASNGFYFNEDAAPFNNILAREAVSYATDPQQIFDVLSPNFGELWETPSGPSSAYKERYAPGFREYNVSKAEQLVQQLGGLSFTLQIGTSTSQIQEGEAFQSQWQAAGMHVTLNSVMTSKAIVNFENGNWQSSLLTGGGFNLDLYGSGLTRRFETGGTYNGVNDPALNGLINQSTAYTSPVILQKVYDKIFAYINQKDYAELIYEQPLDVITAADVTGEVSSPYSANTSQEVVWEDLGYK